MKLDKLELSALLGMQARNRELVFMMEQVKSNIEQLNRESEELFADIEIRLKMEPGTLTNYDVDTATGEILPRQVESGLIQATKISANGSKASSYAAAGITDLEDVD